MLDFVGLKKEFKKATNSFVVYPEFYVSTKSKDLMIKGGKFYAVWDERKGLWSKDAITVQELIDSYLYSYVEKDDSKPIPLLMKNFSSGKWVEFVKYCSSLPDNFTPLDRQIIFNNDEVSKETYCTMKLPYDICYGDCPAYTELVTTLYDPEELEKLEWAIGAIISGESKKLQKFIVLYGTAGSGKSTILNIIEKLFRGYTATFDAKSLGATNAQFAMEAFRDNPLIAIQHDGDLSKIEDNTRLNSIISHEPILMNEKNTKQYKMVLDSFLLMGTNEPVRITNAKSGIIRRLIDAYPSGRLIPTGRYFELIQRVEYELGQIAYRCLEVFKTLGVNYYSKYIPKRMMSVTNDFYDFIETYYDILEEQNYTTLTEAFKWYKNYAEECNLYKPLPRTRFKEELKNYFDIYEERIMIEGVAFRNYYSGFKTSKLNVTSIASKVEKTSWISEATLVEQNSLFDILCKDCPAQYSDGTKPINSWDNCDTILSDIDTSQEHYVRVDIQHVIVDFDKKNENGEKDLAMNIKCAESFPPTYAELSKSGGGLHLHYLYSGDTSLLSNIIEPGIEIKVYKGKSALRRRLSRCNNLDISTISSGLPLKEVKPKVIDEYVIKDDKHLRNIIRQNLRKGVHPSTKQSIEFIKKRLDEAYESGINYDVSDMTRAVLSFACKSTNNARYCMNLVSKMKFTGKDTEMKLWNAKRDIIAFFDCEVFPNLFVIVYKEPDKDCVTMINPTPEEVRDICEYKLIGFNNKSYDNNILYARIMGYSNQELFKLSTNLIAGVEKAGMLQARNLSYTDIYDYAAAPNKMSLKKYEIKLGLKHNELGLPWDQPVDEELWDKVAEYCCDDVIATQAVHEHLVGDFNARLILAELAGGIPNDSTNNLTTLLIFGKDSNQTVKDELVYTDLSKTFPGYFYNDKTGKAEYYIDGQIEEVNAGGYVYAEPGVYADVGLIDVESMHPTSIEQLNLFGKYTERFSSLKTARLHIKHLMNYIKDNNEEGIVDVINQIENLMDGRLMPYIQNAITNKDTVMLKNLSNALKTAINSVYGLTFTKFDNKFRDPRNVDNIVARRGALFMITLKHEVQKRGYTVAHIKTDSIKIPNIDDDILNFVMDFGHKYGYNFDYEAHYKKLALVNDAVYIAKADDGHWSATGAQFAQPYVFKSLFSKEEIIFDDVCETKSVKTSMYLDFNENLDEDTHDYRFVGKVGLFTPVRPGTGGALLLREKDGKYYAVTGTKGFRWKEATEIDDWQNEVDFSYYNKLVNDAIENISSVGDYEWLVDNDTPPWDSADDPWRNYI